MLPIIAVLFYSGEVKHNVLPHVCHIHQKRSTGTGRPTPTTSAPKGVSSDIMDKIKSQLSTEPLKPSPAPPAQPPALPSRSATVSQPSKTGSAPVIENGFADDAWAPRPTSSPVKPPAESDAMAQTKAAWAAPPPPPPPPPVPVSAPPAQAQPVTNTAPVMQPVQNHLPSTPPPAQAHLPQAVSPLPRQRPTPPVSQQKVDPQLLSQWTNPGASQPPSHVQQMAMQFSNPNQPPQPPRSPMNQFNAQPVVSPPPPPQQQQQQQQFIQPASSSNAPSPMMQQQQTQFMQQPMMTGMQPQVASVPLNSALPPPLIPSTTGTASIQTMQPTGVQMNQIGQAPMGGAGRSWANASKYIQPCLRVALY